jgi:DNA-binding transcriptional MerR regulator
MHTTETPPTTKRETWADWMGGDQEPDELFTRAEIVDQANTLIGALGKPVSASDLQLWEKLGVCPRPIRRRRGDAQYALYPRWQAYLIRNVRQLQREGYSLEEVRPRIRAYARMTLGYGRSAIDDEIAADRPTAQAPEDITLWPVLVEELERLSRWWAHIQGVDVDRVEVHVLGTNGRATKYPLPIAPHDNNETD